MPWRKSLYPRLTEKLAAFVRDMSESDAAALSEIRIYCGQPAEFVINERRVRCGEAIEQEDISKLLGALSGYALYRFERQMAEG